MNDNPDKLDPVLGEVIQNRKNMLRAKAGDLIFNSYLCIVKTTAEG